MKRISFRTRILVGLAAAAVVLGGASAANRKNVFSAREKAFFADERTLNFVRPGLSLKITAASIASDGTISATVRITDPQGIPLDREGINSPGVVALSFIAAYIPGGKTQYVAYTTRTQVSNITKASAIQAGADTGGRFTKTAEGEYLYTFGTKAPANFESGSTHTIGVYSSRNLVEFNLGTNYASATFDFVPSGGAVTTVRDVIKSASCNRCHGEINAHGGARRGIEMCVLCHTPQTTDPDTGNTVDLAVMAHKIHSGRDLPSVKAGGKYQIIGFNNTVADYSKVGFPADTRNCTACHAQSGAAAGTNAMRLYAPNKAACGSCHDDLDFAAGKGHLAVTDAQCSQCHLPDGKEFDISIKGSHTIPEFSTQLPGTKLEIVDIKDAVAGKKPIVTFAVKDGSGNPIKPADMTSLNLIIGGDTKDYNTYWSETARTAVMGADGRASYTFTQKIADDAKGTFTLLMTGYRTIKVAKLDNTTVDARDAGINVLKSFPVDNSTLSVRRKVVDTDKCNACHFQLAPHGRSRNQVEACVICHNPTMTDAARRTPAQLPAEGIQFGTMVHRIHAGKQQIRPYWIAAPANVFNDVGFPNELNNCAACHVNGSENLPLADTNLNVTDPSGWIRNAGPASAVCSGCHVSKDAASHFLLNTSVLGEACGVCHGVKGDFSVSKVHAK